MLITEDFLKDIPISKKDFIIKKLESFSTAIKKSRFMFDVPSGFWIRKVIGTNIFKFRVNNGDRVLFTINKDRGDEEIVFLRYCNHNEQIRKAHEINRNVADISTVDFEPQVNEYIEDEADEYLNFQHREYFTEHSAVDLSKLPTIVLEDEYIALLLDDNNEDYLYYLNEEQYKCLKVLGKPLLVCGSAGSGKTMIAAHKLMINNAAGLKTLYITYSNLLKENSERFYNKYKANENNFVDLYTINDFCLNKLDLNRKYLVKFDDFENWYRKSIHLKKSKKYGVIAVWGEISGIIKGYKGDDWDGINKTMQEKDYLSLKYSDIDQNERKVIYTIAVQYNKWLRDNNFYDENDISTMCSEKLSKNLLDKYDFIVVDEVQDMNEAQLALICQLVADKSNIFLTGDVNQIINQSFFNIGRLKKYFYTNDREVEEKKLGKNYRSVSGIVTLLNKLSELRTKYIGKNSYDINETFIRDGKRPLVIDYSNVDFKKLYEEMSKRDYCAIVVCDSEDRDQLKSEGYDTSRVFTLNEIKGLEYKNVLCYNLICKNKDEWDKIAAGETKNNNYYRLFFNQLYVASTRARDMLCIFEDDTNVKLLNELKPFYDISTKFDLVGLQLEKESTVKEWIREAQRLEEAEIYNRAIEAYKRADNTEGEQRCKDKIKNLSVNMWTNLLGCNMETAIRIENEDGNLDKDLIYKALIIIKSTHGVLFEPKLTFVIQTQDGGSALVYNTNIDNYDIFDKLSNMIAETIITKTNIHKNKVTIHVTLTDGTKCVAIPDETGHPYDTIYVTYASGAVELGYARTKNDSISSLFDVFNLGSSNDGTIYDDNMLNTLLGHEHLSKANSLYGIGNYSSAIQEYQKALINIDEKNSEYASAITGSIGNCWIELGNYDKAEEYLQKAISLEASSLMHSEKYNSLGVLKKRRGLLDEAIPLFKKAIQSNPKYDAARNNLMLALGLKNGQTNDDSRKYHVGRNDPCPCGSGRKYKKCCGR